MENPRTRTRKFFRANRNNLAGKPSKHLLKTPTASSEEKKTAADLYLDEAQNLFVTKDILGFCSHAQQTMLSHIMSENSKHEQCLRQSHFFPLALLLLARHEKSARQQALQLLMANTERLSTIRHHLLLLLAQIANGNVNLPADTINSVNDRFPGYGTILNCIHKAIVFLQRHQPLPIFTYAAALANSFDKQIRYRPNQTVLRLPTVFKALAYKAIGQYYLAEQAQRSLPLRHHKTRDGAMWAMLCICLPDFFMMNNPRVDSPEKLTILFPKNEVVEGTGTIAVTNQSRIVAFKLPQAYPNVEFVVKEYTYPDFDFLAQCADPIDRIRKHCFQYTHDEIERLWQLRLNYIIRPRAILINAQGQIFPVYLRYQYDLFQRISQQSCLESKPAEFAFFVLFDLTSACVFLQKHHILHRDIKSGNVLIHERSLTSMLADFSVALSVSPEEFYNGIVSDQPIGTADFSAPENPIPATLAAYKKHMSTRPRPRKFIYSHKSDIYSLGVVILELIYYVHNLPMSTQNALLALANWCTQPSPFHRPDAVDVHAQVHTLIRSYCEDVDHEEKNTIRTQRFLLKRLERTPIPEHLPFRQTQYARPVHELDSKKENAHVVFLKNELQKRLFPHQQTFARDIKHCGLFKRTQREEKKNAQSQRESRIHAKPF